MRHASIVADFEDELRLDQVDAVTGPARDTGWTELGHAGVVDAARAERTLDQVARGGYAPRGLAGVHRDPDVACGEVDAGGLRGLGHPNRVRRRGAKNRCA